jgi:hypothetical protein
MQLTSIPAPFFTRSKETKDRNHVKESLIDVDECWCLLHSSATEDLAEFEAPFEAESGFDSPPVKIFHIHYKSLKKKHPGESDRFFGIAHFFSIGTWSAEFLWIPFSADFNSPFPVSSTHWQAQRSKPIPSQNQSSLDYVSLVMNLIPFCRRSWSIHSSQSSKIRSGNPELQSDKSPGTPPRYETDGDIQNILRENPFASLHTIAEILGIPPETLRLHLLRIGHVLKTLHWVLTSSRTT